MEFAISQPKVVQLPRNEKQTYRLDSKASNVTTRFDLDHNLDLWIFKVKRDLDLWPHTWPWPWIFIVKLWNSCVSEWEGWLTLHKGGGSRWFMTMTMTIWWPRSGVWIYQIVTGVTSVVGVPSTLSFSHWPAACVQHGVRKSITSPSTTCIYAVFKRFSWTATHVSWGGYSLTMKFITYALPNFFHVSGKFYLFDLNSFDHYIWAKMGTICFDSYFPPLQGHVSFHENVWLRLVYSCSETVLSFRFSILPLSLLYWTTDGFQIGLWQTWK